ncbi:P-loop containing nucleoside triphosphate hydrolase [Rhizophagus clarus]|uniref:P-loop containing nucleoside triphosphate hydrolase n=1 Tax=Rhizophagus clarus TaxID=94130 RepID=A0A8H3QFI2_9GLOM|nr:P-loop containing nucleoside triphosphate hydrolase [Rhizophagus clarus]
MCLLLLCLKKDSKRIIRRKSLGRTAFIGSLYNATRDTFCGTTILKTEFPIDSISRADVPNSELSYEYEDSYMEKFNELNVEAELKLSVLAGLISPEGSGKYLNDVKENFKSVKGTLIYKMTSVEENLNIYRDDVKACISTDGLSNTDATHIVIGIKWGAIMIASFECKDTKEEDKSQVEAALRSHFEKLSFSISENDNANIGKDQSDLMKLFFIKLLGDVPHDKRFPQSIDNVRKVITELPSYAKQSNNGNGFPIEYVLYPLSELAKLLAQNITTDSVLTELSEETVLKIDHIFDDLFKPKQRLNDLFNDAKSISNLISVNILDEIKNNVQKIKLEEAKFRKDLAESLVKMRSGKGNINELEDIIKTFQKSVSKSSITAFIDQYRSVSLKADLVLTLKTKKVEFLDNNVTINHILHRYSSGHIYILIDDDIIDGNKSPVHMVFRDLYSLNEKLCKFFIADTQICTWIKSPGFPVIHHYVNGKLKSDDYYNNNKILFTSNLVKFDVSNSRPKDDPIDKMRLAIPCPHVDCPSTICNWRCFKCEQDIEYGYNWYFYCGCGESEITSCKFRCNSPYHNVGYVSFESNALTDLLPSAPPEEINILLLGETGVGKSTFINAFVNYLKFDTLNEAKSGNMEVLISSKFTITDDNYETKTIKIGNDDSNERLENIGMSSTQECKSYVFQAAENKIVRLIDTPGIGDTRGLDQDKKNFENILKYISHHRYLNGICILLKPNNSRLTIIFRFCIQELLSHLHRNAKDNIVFCFTNARGTFYRPGDTLPPLKKQLEELKTRSGVEIKVSQETIYCFDNESFRFLAAIKEPGILFTDADEKNFSESWKKSVDESLRLILYLVGRPPHIVKDTLSLNNSRNIVILLSKPLAEIGQLIQTNIKLIKEQQNEIANSNQTIEELKDRLYIPQIDLEPVTLGYPRTVCTSISCVRSVQIDQTNITKIDYITHCHRHCYLKNVKSDEINNAALKDCKAMDSSGKCNKCGCQWDKHMHITYENKQITTKIIDQNVVKQISKKKSDQETKRAIIEDYQARVNQLQKEQHIINEISLKFAQFLRQNAIAAFNDAYADYLDHFINEEKIKKSADPNNYDEEILKGLEATKRNYLAQIEVIKKAIDSNDPTMPPVLPDDIAELEQKLYDLPINGQTLRKIKEEAKRGQAKAFRYKENYYMPSWKSITSKRKFISNKFVEFFRW